jgi:NADPH:quinone reductase-like Zn-dependent oxidoreductase
MQGVGIVSIGGPVSDIELPDPRPLADDEVLIAVRGAGVANWDEIVSKGGWDVGIAPPMALGVEAAGLVTEVGAAVHDWAPGDEVLTHPLPLRAGGTWAPWLIAPAELLARKPAAMSWAAAAALPVPVLTAEQALSEAVEIKAGETLLIHGGGGVTGGLLVALAAMRGARVTATASSASEARLQELGAAHVVDYHDPEWADAAAATAGAGGFDAAVNAVPGGAASAVRLVRDGGRLTTITEDPPPSERQITITSLYVRSDGSQLRALVELVDAGRLGIQPGPVFPAAAAQEALAVALSGTGGRPVALSFEDVPQPS